MAASGTLQSHAVTPLRVLLFVVGSVFYSLLGILSQLSKEDDGSYAYSLPAVVMVAEALKLAISFALLARECGSVPSAARALFGGPASSWMAFGVPSVMYSVNNMLDMLNNLYMDPGTEQVLVQAKIVTTGLVWRLVFQQRLGARKWCALSLLSVGAVLAGNPTDRAPSLDEKHMFITPFGVVLVCLYVCISASAGVYNEWLFKGPGKNDSLHLCNIRLYTNGIVFNMAIHLWGGSSLDVFAPQRLFSGWNRYTLCLMLVYTFMGLLISQIMKRFDNIVKVFMSGSSMYLSALVSWWLFGYRPTPGFAAGLALTSVALALYNADKLASAVSETRKVT